MMQLLINELYRKLTPHCINDILEKSWSSRGEYWKGCVPNGLERYEYGLMYNYSYWNRQQPWTSLEIFFRSQK